MIDRNSDDDDGNDDHDHDKHYRGEELLQALCEKRQLNTALNVLSRMYTAPSISTCLSLLKACIKKKALTHAKRVYAHLVHHRVQLTGLLGGYLVVTLAKCGAIEDAYQLSCTLPHRSVFSWTAMISAYAECGRGQEALKLHQCMQEDGVEPNAFTYASLFKACGSIPDLAQGKTLHNNARRKGFTSHVFVGNTLVSMYGKCGALAEAEDMFSALSQHDAVSWNAMLSAYVEQGQGERALQSYRQMQEEGVSPDQLTFVIALQACGTLLEKEDSDVVKGRSIKMMAFETGQALHKDALNKGYASDIFISNTLVSMYGKCGNISKAEEVFSALCRRSVVSWNAMLSQYAKQGQAERALLLYKKMQEEGMSPNHLTFVSALQACGTLAEKEESTKMISLEIGRALHTDAQRKGCLSDILVGNTLVSMYGKCGTIVEAEDVFKGLSHRDIVSWNAMLSAYLEQEKDEKAFWLYRQMLKEGVTVDDATLNCTLQACSGVGSLEICKEVHFDIVSAGFDQVTSVAAPLIHAYATCASIVDAQAVFDELHKPDIVSWTACIAGHAGVGNAVASLHMFEKLKLAGIRPDGLAFTSVLSACTRTGLVAEGLEHFESMSRGHNVTPDPKHFDSMVDLLGRAGDFKRVENMLGRMSMQTGFTSWLHLLGACRLHGNLELAKHAFDYAVNLQPKQSIAYVLMSMNYADAGLQKCVCTKGGKF